MNGLKEFNIDDFELGKNYAIEASAGTGKTHTIVDIVTKLLKSGMDLKNILIVTYTEKAAEELKTRIREVIPDADIDNATIGTIHSFCKNAIEEFCIASGKPSNLELIDENDARDFAKRYIRTKNILREIAAIKKFIIEVNKACGKVESCDVENEIIERLGAIAKSYYLDKCNKEVKEIIEFKQLINDGVKIAFENILNGKKITEDRGKCIADALDVMQNSSTQELKDLRDSIKNVELPDFTIPSGLYASTRLYKGLPQDEKDAFELIKKIKDGIKDKNLLIKYFVFKYSKDFYEKWQDEKTKTNAQTYNDMIRNVREEVVNNGPLLIKLQERYKLAIIDEFQDTNQKQWDIFSRVFLSENHNIIVVGDPKQSIYAFQGSDINVYKNAIKEIAANGGEVRSLPMNYRASEKIVDSTGNFFSDPVALSNDLAFAPSSCGKKYFKFIYDGKTDLPAYWVYVEPEKDEKVEADENKTDVDKAILSEQDTYSKIVCQTIIDCCTKDANGNTKLRIVREKDDEHPDHYEDNVSFKDFAILTRTRTEMPEIKRALENSGIPYMQYKDTSVFTGIECANWIAILDAIAASDFSGRNRSKFRKALYTTFFGYRLDEINSSEFDKDNIPEAILFDKWRRCLRESRWEDLIIGIIIDTGLESKLNSLKDIKAYGVFNQIAGYCIDYLVKCQSIDLLIANLKKLQKNINDDEYDENDNNLMAISTDFDCVKVMTIHASKGLEFPVVISAGGFKGPYPSIKLYNYHNGDDHIISFEKPDDGIYDKERTAEWQRLFYVAYTRAKYVLMLPNYQKTGDKFIKKSIDNYVAKYEYRLLEDNKKTYDDLKQETAAILSSSISTLTNSVTKEEQKDVLKKIIENKKEHSTYKHAYSSLSHHKPKAENMTDDQLSVSEEEDNGESGLEKYDLFGKQIACNYDTTSEPIALSEDFPAGAGLGNAVHDVFELIDYSNDIRNNKNETLINNSFERQGFGKTCKWVDDIYSIVENVISAKLPEIHGNVGTGKEFSLSELCFSDRKNEVEFNFNRESEELKNYFNGFIDLIIKRGEYYSVLDWKSDRLKDDFSTYSDGEIIKKHIDELYSIQRVLYSYCLIKWLGNFYKGLSDQEIFEQHFGGVYYICIRGCNVETGNGVYAQTWENFKQLEEAYRLIIKERIGV